MQNESENYNRVELEKNLVMFESCIIHCIDRILLGDNKTEDYREQVQNVYVLERKMEEAFLIADYISSWLGEIPEDDYLKGIFERYRKCKGVYENYKNSSIGATA